MVLAMALPKKITAVRKFTYDVENLVEVIADAHGFKWEPGMHLSEELEATVYDLVNDFAEEDLSCGLGHRVDKYDYELIEEGNLYE